MMHIRNKAGAAIAVAAGLAMAVFGATLPAGAAEAEAAGGGKPHAMGQAGMTHDMSIRLSIADGAVLTKPPTAVRFDFVPAMRLSSVVLTNVAGEKIPVTFESKSAAGTVTVTFAPLEPDAYSLAFSADAGDHDMPGRVRFTVR